MSTWTPRTSQDIAKEEQQLYDHLLYLVQCESPSQLVQRFRSLFVEGSTYPDAAIVTALDKIVASQSAEQEFRFVLNRCCHILVNRWQARPQHQIYIPEIVDLLVQPPDRPALSTSRSRSVRKLRELVKDFTVTEQYLALRRLASVLAQPETAVVAPETQPLGTLIRRYPYLYDHCLLAEGSTSEQQETIRDLRSRVQRQYEIDLSQFATYQVLRSRMQRSHLPSNARAGIKPIGNPTLLPDQELCHALKHFAGKSQGSATYRDVAQRFLTHTAQPQPFRVFKDDLYQYITASIDSDYGKRQFNNQLYKQLKDTLPEGNQQPVNDFMMVRTCSQLLNFLIVESPTKPHHFLLVDLLSNVGPAVTTGIFLKIILICRKVKPHLEKRFSILFNHYEASQRQTVSWLVQAMEYLNLALSTHFSTLDLSVMSQW